MFRNDFNPRANALPLLLMVLYTPRVRLINLEQIIHRENWFMASTEGTLTTAQDYFLGESSII